MAATTISRTARTDGSSGTILDNAEKVSLYNEIDALFTSAFTFGDLVHSEGAGVNVFSAGVNGSHGIRITNTTAGTTARGELLIGNDADADLVRLQALSSSFTETGALKQNGMAVRGLGAGGISLAAEDASGDIRLYANGTTKVATYDGDYLAFAAGGNGAYRAAHVPATLTDTSDSDTGADTVETDLHSHTLPANFLPHDGAGFHAVFAVDFAGNANTKRVKIYIDGTVVFNTGNVAFNNEEILFEVYCIRSGAATGRSVACGQFTDSGLIEGDIVTGLTPTWSGAVIVKLTGENGTASASDISCKLSFVQLLG